MNCISKNNLDVSPVSLEHDTSISEREQFMSAMFAQVDKAVASELERLGRDEGILPTCKKGCSYCCKYHVVMNVVEAHVLGQYIRREFSAEQIESLRLRTQRWHDWDCGRRDQKTATHPCKQPEVSNYNYSCPLLVKGACSVYPVRPVICRTHFVCSDKRKCDAVNSPGSLEAVPEVLVSVIEAVISVTTAIQDYIEKSGIDYSRSHMLIPHWLAYEMGWDFRHK